MAADTVQNLLGPGAATAFVLALFTLYQKLRENRTTLRAAYETREQQRYEQDWQRNEAYRAAAEAHLPYDIEMRAGMMELRHVVNHLERRLGETPTVWTPLPQAPPLFPPRTDDARPGDQQS